MAYLTNNARERILRNVPSTVRPIIKWPYYLANVLFASEPRFVVIGTGRSGTKFTARLLDNIGVGCSHEAYYTPNGPTLRNKNRYFKAATDASWLAVPFLPDQTKRVLHQVRHPVGVISSFYKLGFFDPDYYHRHQAYVDFAKKHFQFSSSPLRSCTRWYIEWNSRCEKITDYRIQLESFSESVDTISHWLQVDKSVLERSAEMSPVNARRAIVDFSQDDLADRLRQIPEYAELIDTAARYGYEID